MPSDKVLIEDEQPEKHMSDKVIIEVEGLEKHFGDHQVLRDISFEVKQGEVICIIGSSGSGKSTLLRCINFLEQPTGGEILYHGKNAETEWKRTLYNSKVLTF